MLNDKHLYVIGGDDDNGLIYVLAADMAAALARWRRWLHDEADEANTWLPDKPPIEPISIALLAASHDILL